MNHAEHNPTLPQLMTDKHLDYSEMYRTQEVKQLNKRLRKTRNTLWISAAATVLGGAIFWSLPESTFTLTNFFIYMGLGFVFLLLSAFSNKHPFYAILTALIICLITLGAEIALNPADGLLIEGAILKLFIVSLLVSAFHSSKEAELIRKELDFC